MEHITKLLEELGPGDDDDEEVNDDNEFNEQDWESCSDEDENGDQMET